VAMSPCCGCGTLRYTRGMRQLTATELEAIAAWLREHCPTRCPATGQGTPLPFLQSVETLAREAGLARQALAHQELLRRQRAAGYLRFGVTAQHPECAGRSDRLRGVSQPRAPAPDLSRSPVLPRRRCGSAGPPRPGRCSAGVVRQVPAP
jgi:hypothetical protein